MDVHTKNIFQTKLVSEVIAREGSQKTVLPYHHFWNGYPIDGFRILDVLKRSVDGYTKEFPASARKWLDDQSLVQKILETTYIAHFSFKSESDFMRRVKRGGFPDQQMWKDVFEDGRYIDILDNLNAVDDLYLSEYWKAYIWHTINFR